MVGSLSILAWMLLLSYLSLCSNGSQICTCQQFDNGTRAQWPDCEAVNHTCEAALTCYTEYAFVPVDNILSVRQGCYDHYPSFYDSLCFTNSSKITSICCEDSVECNKNLFPSSFPLEYQNYLDSLTTPTPITDETSSAVSTSDNPSALKAAIIVIPIFTILVIIALLVFVCAVLMLCVLFRRKRRVESEQLDMKPPLDQQPVLYPAYSLDTLDLLNQSCTSGSGSGAPILTQRTVARNITIGAQIGNGRFGQVFVGLYQGDEMAVKKFASRDEKSWVRETEIYNTVLLRHDNILGFFASDIFSDNGVTELWLITQYHPYGSLYDYLNKRTLTPTIMMRMAISTCRGLTHLHTEFKGSAIKPAIGHRDIKSRNILVKRNRECCIADFGLAVMKSSNGSMNFPTNPRQGTRRYMAPEVLSETIDMTRFESFLEVDIYAFGLVLWEMCKRTADKNESVGEYEAPFQDLVGQDPSFEEMRKIVVHDRRKPSIPSHWKNSDLFQGMSQLMEECWFFDSSARNNAVFFKMKLYKIAEEDKIDYEHDDHE